MATTIKVTYKKVDYILEYNRRTASQIESQGFVLSELADKPNVMVPLLVEGAFYMHHRGIKRKLVEEIYDHLTGKTPEGEDSFIAVLASMYADTINTLTADNKDTDEGNVATWSVVQ